MKTSILALLVLALAALGSWGGVASASNRPSVTVTGPTATVATTTSTITYSANRGGKQLLAAGGLTCSLTGPTRSSSCGTVTTDHGTTRGTVQLTDLESGDYTFSVTIRLTNGAIATGTSGFTVLLPLPDLVPVLSCVPGWVCDVRVQNIGLGTANQFFVVQYSLHDSAGNGVSNQQCGISDPLPPGAIHDCAEAGNGVDGATSMHMDATVDVTNLVAESNETNNSASQDFSLT